MKLLKTISRFKKPIMVRRVRGHSMEPQLRSGQIAIFSSLSIPSADKVVISSHNEKDYVKRLRDIDGELSLIGDNSYDSDDLYGVDMKAIHGSMIYPTSYR